MYLHKVNSNHTQPFWFSSSCYSKNIYLCQSRTIPKIALVNLQGNFMVIGFKDKNNADKYLEPLCITGCHGNDMVKFASLSI